MRVKKVFLMTLFACSVPSIIQGCSPDINNDDYKQYRENDSFDNRAAK